MRDYFFGEIDLIWRWSLLKIDWFPIFKVQRGVLRFFLNVALLLEQSSKRYFVLTIAFTFQNGAEHALSNSRPRAVVQIPKDLVITRKSLFWKGIFKAGESEMRVCLIRILGFIEWKKYKRQSNTFIQVLEIND
jgi:hypothetical protein